MKPGGQLGPGPNAGGFGDHRRGAIVAQPLKAGGCHLRHEFLVGNVVADEQAREHHLLDDIAVGVEHLGLQGHAGGALDPHPVAIAEAIARSHADDLRLLTHLADRALALQQVVLRHGAVEFGQPGRHQARRGLLDQHRTLIGQVAGQFGAAAHELPPGAIQGLKALRDRAVDDAVDDAQGLDATALPMREDTDVVARGERGVHAVEPVLRRVRGERTGRLEGQGEPQQWHARRMQGDHFPGTTAGMG